MEESFQSSPLFLGLIFTQWLIIFGTKNTPEGVLIIDVLFT